MSETTTTETAAPVMQTPAPSSLLARWRADIEAEAKALGVDVEKLWALVKEHM